MFRQSTIDRLREYTSEHRPERLLGAYENNGQLLAQDVFEPGNDIFLNLHTMRDNSSTNELHGHDFFEIVYILRGSCTQHLASNAPITLQNDVICIMNPNARHNLRVNEAEDLVINISLKRSLFSTTFFSLIEQHDYIGQFFLSYFLSLDRTSDFMLFHITPDSGIDRLIEALCIEYLDRRTYYAVNMRCILVLIFSEMVRASSQTLSNQPFTDKVSVQITALFNYLSVNYATATLESTAAYFHYHPHYLSAFVKKNTGRTFRSILNEIKLFQASYYLLNTNMPIKTISERLGFTQLCNFYDFIKRNYHTTPVRFRQMNAPGTSQE